MTDECVFCGIVAGEVDSHVVARTADTVAFLDRTPLFPGHVLVVPVEHHVTVMDLPDAAIAPLFTEVRRVATAVRAALGAEGVFVAANNIVSQSVAHLHVHVVPRNRKDGLRGFFWPRQRYRDDEHARTTAATLRAALR